MRAKKGFTLVEMLLVISITMILSLMTTYYYINNQPQLPINIQCNMIVSLLQEAKTLAIVNHEKVAIEFTSDSIGYQKRTLNLDHHYYFQNYYELHFNQNGNINQGGTLIVSDGNQEAKIVLNVGSGAIYVR